MAKDDAVAGFILGLLGLVALAHILSQKKCSYCGNNNPNANAVCNFCGRPF